MKLATYILQDVEKFGLVLPHPATGELWVFDPEQVETLLTRYANHATSPYRVSQPRFLASRPWPQDMISFLGLGDAGMSALRRLSDFLLRFLEQSDACLLAGAGCPLEDVRLQAPIPRPRLYFGLVQNSARTLRRQHHVVWNIYPQGHARPQGSVLGPGDAVYVGTDARGTSWNPELGVIIGRGGKDIDVHDAHKHIAGLTVVLDMHNGDYQRLYREHGIDPKADWFADATTSWLGKLSDTMGPMGPTLTTMDEIGNPYDLLVYSRLYREGQPVQVIDRSHTNSMLIGIERLISWLSSFMTLYPGDVLHMATMGRDGMPIDLQRPTGPDDYWEGEIERVGVLRVPVVKATLGDWRASDDPSRTIHPSPAVRHAIQSGNTAIEEPEDWGLDRVRHFWTLHGNYEAAPELEDMAHISLPRMIHGPARALSTSGEPIVLAHRAQALSIGPELAFVVGRLACQVSEEDATDYILGYLTLASITDDSFGQHLQEPATPQALSMPRVYGRWGDGYNAVSAQPVALARPADRGHEIRGRAMRLAVDGWGEVIGNTDQYLLLAPAILSFVSRQITLFPGDVITLGRVTERLTVPGNRRLPAGTMLRASIEGIGKISSSLVDEREGQ
jgi:2-keto-4-pentenoate hydratase/2-oxohepta-3-ene-1,7-dioic acid hydratase in catechol pathway